ncbi:hypothetical protein ABEB36_014983 [Hypothenemus hampei]|uniref:Uncharacterized protein n=1 Tax=Hypothenemus hampei TaxID=57062 RepID=A0ABD1E1F6_HYPHA
MHGIVENYKEKLICNKTLGSSEIKLITHEPQKAEKFLSLRQHKFKTLLELVNGNNKFEFQFACQTLSFDLRYCKSDAENTVMPLYVMCLGHDGTFQAPSNQRNNIESACKRILLCSKLLQCFTAENLMENGLGRKTFHLEDKVQVFNTTINYSDAREISQEHLWEQIDVMGSIYEKCLMEYLFISQQR